MSQELKQTTEELKALSADLKNRIQKQLKDNDEQVSREELEKRISDLEAKSQQVAKLKPRRSEFEVSQANLSYDMLLKSKSDRDEVVEFQKRCDALLLMSSIKKMHPTQMPFYKVFKRETDELGKAMSAATGSAGGDWVPTDFSNRLYRQVELESKVAGLFDDVPMPTDNFKLPIDTAGLTLYKQGEASSDTEAKITASSATVANVQLNAQKLALRALFSTELQEDSIVDVMNFINERMARAIAAGWDNVLLNSDTAGTHMDSDVTASTDIRKSFLGIRALAVDGSHGAAIAGANLAESDLRIARKAMGKYGVDPNKLAIITGPVGYLEMLTQFSNFQTADKYGPHATIFNGELAKFDGIPVIISDQYRENLNATGVHDGVTETKTSVSLVYRPALVTGTRRGITIKTSEDIQTDQMIAVVTLRKALIDLYDESTEAFAYHVFNVA